MSVRRLFPHNGKTYGQISIKISGINSGFAGTTAQHLWFWKSTSGLSRNIENGIVKQVFGSYPENVRKGFRNSNGIGPMFKFDSSECLKYC